jgi:hypothetical protein
LEQLGCQRPLVLVDQALPVDKVEFLAGLTGNFAGISAHVLEVVDGILLETHGLQLGAFVLVGEGKPDGSGGEPVFIPGDQHCLYIFNEGNSFRRVKDNLKEEIFDEDHFGKRKMWKLNAPS